MGFPIPHADRIIELRIKMDMDEPFGNEDEDAHSWPIFFFEEFLVRIVKLEDAVKEINDYIRLLSDPEAS